ncbi:MAG: nodulation protein NfeD [Gemmataceae bacterium]
MARQSYNHERLGQSPDFGVRFAGLVSIVCGMLLSALPSTVYGQSKPNADTAARDGLVLHVPNPLTSVAVKRIQNQVEYAVNRKHRQLDTIVFVFQRPEEVVGTADFHPCNELQDYITSLNQGTSTPKLKTVTTVAFLQGRTSQHSVWPVLACQRIVMKDSATLGTIVAPGQQLSDLTKAAQATYKAQMDKPEWKAFFKKLLRLDENVGALGFSLVDLKDELAKVGLSVQQRQSIEDIRVKDNFMKLSTQPYRLADIATPKTWLVELVGPVDDASLASLRRRIQNGIERGADLFILQLDSPKGDPAAAADFFDSHMEHWRNPQKVGRTIGFVAYVPPRCTLGAATYIALGCDEIVLGKGATLADFSYLRVKTDKYLAQRRRELMAIANAQDRNSLLFSAPIAGDAAVYKIKRTQSSPWNLVTKTQAAKTDHLVDKRPLNASGGFLAVDETLAREFGAADVVGVRSLGEVYAEYGIDPQTVRVADKDSLDQVAELFRNGWVRFFLLLVGLTALILELKMPGFGFPGVLAAICFVLLFWAHWSVGQFAILSVFLFILGLVLLAVEVFVIPGFGVTGISGICLAVVSLVLMTVEQMPNSTSDWMSLGGTFSSVILSMVGAVVLAISFASLLPHIPYANRLMLVPPGEDATDGENANSGQQYVRLLGAIGLAETPLRPSGKAKFEGEYYDVLSEGEFITPGSRVQVVEVEGNRIVVKLI